MDVGRTNMNIFTKPALKSIFLKTMSLMTILAITFAIEAKSPEKKERTVDVKCFVELVGGGNNHTVHQY